MKKVGFLALAGGIGYIIALFLPELPGLMGTVTFTGTVAAMAGAAVGIPISEKKSTRLYFGVAVLCVVVFILGLALYRGVAQGEPGAGAALLAYLSAALMFFPIGLLVEVTSIRIWGD